jgi:N-acyl-D-amino-acid deacylase
VRLRDLAVDTGVPVTWGLFSRREAPGVWKTYVDLLEETAARGGRMFAQVHSRALTVVLSFKTNLPFDRLPVWSELRARPLDDQRRQLRDPAVRRRLVEAARERDERRALGGEPRPAVYEWIFLMDTATGPHRSVADIARERGVDPVEAMIDLALEKDLDRFFLQPIANEDQDAALALMRTPRTVVTFSDSGAHVSQIMDSSLQTHLLSHWVREKQAFTLEEAVRMLTLVPATYWGFADRGLLREGTAADLVVFDPETVAPEMPDVVHDLPAGARRLVQRARGFAATIVNGEVLLRDGKPTGNLPGRLLRGPLARRAAA